MKTWSAASLALALIAGLKRGDTLRGSCCLGFRTDHREYFARAPSRPERDGLDSRRRIFDGAEDPRGMPGGGMQSMDDSRPIHRVYVDGFWMDATDVTNEQSASFVKATGYLTIAERTPTRAQFPDAPTENLVAGSLVYSPTLHPVALND